jgi:PAS domain S-box-containing protein
LTVLLFNAFDTLKNLSRILLVAAIYFIVARLSLFLQFQNSNASPVWPPSGIALAALIVFGRRVWPGIFIGAFAANVVTFLSNQSAEASTSVIVSLFIAGGNSLEAIAGNYLLSNKNGILGIRRQEPLIENASYLQKVNNVFWFLYAALIMCLVSAVIGTTSIYVVSIITPENFLKVSFTWWVGDVAGVLVTTPLLLAWLKPARPYLQRTEPVLHPLSAADIKWRETIETIALFVGTTLMSGIIFYGWLMDSFTLTRAFFIIPLLVWAALRFRMRVLTSAIALVAGVSVFGTINLRGPFVNEIMNESLITASAFIAVLSMTSLALHAVLNERRRSEEELRIAQDQLKILVKEGVAKFRQSEDLFSKIFRASPTGVAINSVESGKFIDVNQSFLSMLGYTREEVLGRDAIEINLIRKEQRDKNMFEIRNTGSIKNKELILSKKSGEELDVLYSLELFEVGDEKFSISILHDITERKSAEALAAQKQREVEKNRQFLLDSQEVGRIGSWERDLVDNTITGSPEYFKILNLTSDGEGKTSFTAFLDRVHQDDRKRVKDIIEKTVVDKSQYDIEYRIMLSNGEQRVIWAKGKAVYRTDGNPDVFRGTVLDITARKEAENKLAELADELSRSNKELEQFAYVASHDLQEPLRIVTSYVQLLERRFMKTADPEAKEFMDFIVDAVGRMRSLIQDLLAYSRVGTQVKPFTNTDMNRALNIALDNLSHSIEECRAEIIHHPLPEVIADDSQMSRLFQNLIGNAIKFRSSNPPRIEISAEEKRSHFLFSIKDNGLGIADEYRERIFVIFQRLNDRSQYPGTGIGLAICQKIVQLHGGRIWTEPNKEGGSTFYFTIKK